MLLVISVNVPLGSQSHAQSAVQKPVEVSINHDVGYGNEICLSGSHPALGGGDPRLAPKLVWTPGNHWRAKVHLPAGANLSARFVVRDFSTSQWGNAANAQALGPSFMLEVAPHSPPPWGTKHIFYRTGWPQPRILYRNRTVQGPWRELSLQRWGPGRSAGENTVWVKLDEPSGDEIEWVFHNGAGAFDNPPSPPPITAYQGQNPPHNFRSALDVVLVQDGQLYTYLPSFERVDSPRRETLFIESDIAGVPGRPITVILPRGYDQQVSRHYPVALFLDGQNVFAPGGPFGSWDADLIARHEMAQGRMRECILVSIPNGNAYGSNRLTEYVPDGETIRYLGQSYRGNAEAFGRFLAERVIPALRSRYRLLAGAAHCALIGSSMGGLAADYLSFTRPQDFGVAGIFSPAYWAAPQWVSRRNQSPLVPVRRFISMGTAESSAGESSANVYWQDAISAGNAYLRAGHSHRGDLLFVGVPGGLHNEAAWSRLLPTFFAFALNPWHEANELSLLSHPPNLALSIDESLRPPVLVLAYTARYGFNHTLWQCEDLLFGANALSSPEPPATELWSERYLALPLPPWQHGFWRLEFSSAVPNP